MWKCDKQSVYQSKKSKPNLIAKEAQKTSENTALTLCNLVTSE